MTFRIAKRFRFSASHQLTGLPAGHPCARLHGHNYTVEVVLAAPEVDRDGMVAEFGRLGPVKAYLDQRLDHRHLNDVLTCPPTSEGLARHLFDWCQANVAPDLVAKLSAVRVSETDTSWAEYQP